MTDAVQQSPTNFSEEKKEMSTDGINMKFLYGLVFTSCLGGLQYGFAISLFSTLRDPFNNIFNWGTDDQANN
jgi:hypothetical protein